MLFNLSDSNKARSTHFFLKCNHIYHACSSTNANFCYIIHVDNVLFIKYVICDYVLVYVYKKSLQQYAVVKIHVMCLKNVCQPI